MMSSIIGIGPSSGPTGTVLVANGPSLTVVVVPGRPSRKPAKVGKAIRFLCQSDIMEDAEHVGEDRLGRRLVDRAVEPREVLRREVRPEEEGAALRHCAALASDPR